MTRKKIQVMFYSGHLMIQWDRYFCFVFEYLRALSGCQELHSYYQPDALSHDLKWLEQG